jgi:hypothetical protein
VVAAQFLDDSRAIRGCHRSDRRAACRSGPESKKPGSITSD